jgi:hypothetical protein
VVLPNASQSARQLKSELKDSQCVTHWLGRSIGGSSVSKYGIWRAFVADNLLAGFIANNPSATSIAAGDNRLLDQRWITQNQEIILSLLGERFPEL